MNCFYGLDLAASYDRVMELKEMLAGAGPSLSLKSKEILIYSWSIG